MPRSWTKIFGYGWPLPKGVNMNLKEKIRTVDFCSRSRYAKKITIGIYLIFRRLFFEHNEEIGQKDHLWMDTSWSLTQNQAYKTGINLWRILTVGLYWPSFCCWWHLAPRSSPRKGNPQRVNCPTLLRSIRQNPNQKSGGGKNLTILISMCLSLKRSLTT